MKIIKLTVVLFLLGVQVAASQEYQHSVPMDRLVRQIGNLEADDLTQTATRSRIEACALKVRFGYPNDDPPSEEIMRLRVSDLNENDIDLDYDPETNGWDLFIYCNDMKRRVLVIDEEYGDSYENLLMVSDRDKEVLITLKETVIAAIRECKAQEE